MNPPATTTPTVSIIVLNYNARQYLEDCFASLLKTDYPRDRYELICVDNASTDGSLDYMHTHLRDVRIIENRSNHGFAAGNNIGAQAARGGFVVFLNPDMRVDPAWLWQLVSACGMEPRAVCAAAKILDWDGRHIDFADAAMNFMGWGCQPEYGSAVVRSPQQPKRLLFGCGGALLIERQSFLSAGGFDEDFFAFFEDVDLGWRLNLMGQTVRLAPHATVYHHHHGSWAPVEDVQKWVLYERNALFNVIKNYGDLSLAQTLPAILLLLVQRAYLDIDVDPSVFGFAPPRLELPAFGPRYYLDQIGSLVHEHAYRELTQRTFAEIRRRWTTPRRANGSATQSPQIPVNGMLRLPTRALARLLAAKQVRTAFTQLMAKRQIVQGMRRRTDYELFPLFQSALHSNFADSRFIHAMDFSIARFGLVDVFARQIEPLSADQQVISLSRKVSLDLLDILAYAFDCSGIDPDAFAVGHSPPQATLGVPAEAAAVLAELVKLMWSVPAAGLGEVLNMLSEGCERIIAATSLQRRSGAKVLLEIAPHA